MFTVDSSEEVSVAIVRPSNNKIKRTGEAIHSIRTILLPAADLERSKNPRMDGRYIVQSLNLGQSNFGSKRTFFATEFFGCSYSN